MSQAEVQITGHLTEAGLVSTECLACIDGRVAHGRIGAPGADIGELLLVFAAAEAELDVELSDAWIRRALLAIADRRGGLSMHTDVMSQRELFARMGQRYRPNAQIELVNNWREVIVQPATLGCGHLRSMCVHPRLYGVRRALVERTIRAFYALRATGAPMVLDVLQDVHRETKFVQVLPTTTGATKLHALAVAPEGGAFVEHPVARRIVRDSFIEALDDDGLFMAIGALERIRSRIPSVEVRHREATLALLAPNVERSTFVPMEELAAAE